MVRAVESKPSQIKARRLIKQQLKRDLEPETVDELDEEEGISVRREPVDLIKRARLSLPAPSTSLSASSNIRSRRQTSILPLRNIEPVPSRNVNVNIRRWRKSMLSGPPPDLEKRQEIVRVLANIALEALLTVGKVDEQGHVIKFDGERVAHWKSFVACRKANLSGISGNDFLDAKALSTYGDMLNDPDSSFNSLVRLCNLTTFLYLIISSAPTDTNQYSKKAAANLKLAAWSFDTLVQPPNDTLHDGLLEMILSIKCQEYLAECSRASNDSARPDPAKYFGTHIYEAIDYGTEGRLPLSKVENLARREAETRYKSYSSRALSLAKDLDGDVAVLATRWVWNDVQDEVRNYCEELARRVAPRDEFRLSDESDDDEEGDVTMRVDQMMERGTSKQAAARREMDEEDESVLSQVDQSEGEEEEGIIQTQSSPLRSDRSEQDRATLKEEEDDDDNEFVARSLGVSPATSRTSNFAGTVAVEKTAEEGEDEDQISDGDTEMGVEDSETQAYRMAEFADLEAELAEAQEADRSAALAIEMDAELMASLARDEEEEDREQDEGDDEADEQERRENEEEQEEENQEEEEEEILVTVAPARMNSMRKQVSAIVAETIQFKNGGLQRAPPKATKLSLLDRQADAEKILFDSQSQPSLSPAPPPAQQRKQNKRHVLSDSELDDDDHSTQDVLTQLVPSTKKSKKSNKSVQPASSPSKQRTTRSMVSAASQRMSKVKKITRDAEKENLGKEEDDDDDDDDDDAMEAGRGRRSWLPALMEDEKMDEFSDEDQNQDQLQSGGQVDYPRDLHDDFQDYGGGEEYAAQDEEEEDELDNDEEEEEGEGVQVQQREVLVASAKKSQKSPTKLKVASNTSSRLAPTSTLKSASKSNSTTKPASKSSSKPSTSRRKRGIDETTSEEESGDDSDEEEKAAAAKRKAKFEAKERKRAEERRKAKRRKAKGKYKAVSPPSDDYDENNKEEEEDDEEEEEEEEEMKKVKHRKAKGKGKAKPASDEEEEEEELDDDSEPGLTPSARKEKKRSRLLYGRPIKRDVPTSPPSDKSSDDVPQVYASGNGRGAGTTDRWTEEETELFHNEAKKYGISWAAMLKRHGPNGTKSTVFKRRDGGALKDKARNIINKHLKDRTEIPKYFCGILESNAVKQRLATKPKQKELSSSSGSGSGSDDDDNDDDHDHGAAASARRAESSDSDDSNLPSP